ncbi:hypothetical protein O181_102857 [Austropuccinia psidii MF-1]|uniref:Uncharacterized protein n=1 Tax=Austropuccinia psidii MF-1 TaxID=1389203 RepID=A0A9Q3JIP5_9BASI|nr:hypothetical protein [Austropuccinia psidii MF-1]
MQIKNINDPNSHMPRPSTPLTEEKMSMKESLTPFLGEKVIYASDISKLEEGPTLSGEGKYNHIKLIRTIDMIQEDLHIADEIVVGDYTTFSPELQRKGITR